LTAAYSPQMAAPCSLKALAHCTVLLLTVRGAFGGDFGVGDIGRAIRSVSQDAPKMPNAVQQRIQHAAENPQRLVGGAGQALAGVDAARAVGTAGVAARSASGALPAVSVAVGGSQAGAGPSTTALPTELPGEAATRSQVVQDALSDAFGGRGVKDAVGKATPGGVAGAIAKLTGARIEGAASRVAERGQEIADAVQDASVKDIVRAASGPAATPVSAVGQAVGRAKRAWAGQRAEAAGLADKAKTATVKDMMDLVGADGAKKGAAIVKGSTWQDLSDAVRRDDVQSAIADPERTAQKIGKSKFLSPTRGRQVIDGADVDGEQNVVDARLVAVIVFAGLAVGAYALLRRLSKPRPAGVGMLSGDHEQDSVAAARSWMGTSARDVISSAPGGNSAGFSRF